MSLHHRVSGSMHLQDCMASQLMTLRYRVVAVAFNLVNDQFGCIAAGSETSVVPTAPWEWPAGCRLTERIWCKSYGCIAIIHRDQGWFQPLNFRSVCVLHNKVPLPPLPLLSSSPSLPLLSPSLPSLPPPLLSLLSPQMAVSCCVFNWMHCFMVSSMWLLSLETFRLPQILSLWSSRWYWTQSMNKCLRVYFVVRLGHSHEASTATDPFKIIIVWVFVSALLKANNTHGIVTRACVLW